MRFVQVFCFVFLGSAAAAGQTYTTTVDHGASANRVDMVFVGDGYQDFEIESTYASDVDTTVDYFFGGAGNPFPRYRKFFNVHRVNVISNESGADDPRNNRFVDTALNATYNTNNIDRCLYFDTGLANQAVSNALSGTGIDVDMRLGAVNSQKYGGCGGSWAVWSASNASALPVSVHEVGHSFAGLADEYWNSGSGNWTGGEPGSVNITSDPELGKWDRWVGYVDPDSNIGEIGYYEGGRYYETGLYRPSQNSMMRNLNRPLDAIGRERFIEEIYEEVRPLDDWVSDSAIYDYQDTLWVESVDSDVIAVEWFVDGQSIGVLNETLEISSLGLGIGEYTVEARAYDEILDFSFTGLTLDWWRLDDTSLLEQSVSWTVNITAVPEPASQLLIMVGIGIGLARRRRFA